MVLKVRADTGRNGERKRQNTVRPFTSGPLRDRRLMPFGPDDTHNSGPGVTLGLAWPAKNAYRPLLSDGGNGVSPCRNV